MHVVQASRHGMASIETTTVRYSVIGHSWPGPMRVKQAADVQLVDVVVFCR